MAQYAWELLASAHCLQNQRTHEDLPVTLSMFVMFCFQLLAEKFVVSDSTTWTNLDVRTVLRRQPNCVHGVSLHDLEQSTRPLHICISLLNERQGIYIDTPMTFVKLCNLFTVTVRI